MTTGTTGDTPSNRTSDRSSDTINSNHHHQHRCSLEGGDKNGRNCLDLLWCQWEAVSTRKWNRRMGELSNHVRGTCHPWISLTSSKSWHINIAIRSDAQILIRAINGRDQITGLYGILQDIHNLTCYLSTSVFSFISRKDKIAADNFAKKTLLNFFICM